MDAAMKLQAQYSVRVVSVPALTELEKQSKEYIDSIIPADARCVVVEAAKTQGWGDFIRQPLLRIDMKGYGKSAPLEVLAEHFGFTAEKIALAVDAWMKQA
jgi:transketolase